MNHKGTKLAKKIVSTFNDLFKFRGFMRIKIYFLIRAFMFINTRFCWRGNLTFGSIKCQKTGIAL